MHYQCFFCDGGSTCLFRASFATSASTSFLKQTIHPKSGWKTRKKLFCSSGFDWDLPTSHEDEEDDENSASSNEPTEQIEQVYYA